MSGGSTLDASQIDAVLFVQALRDVEVGFDHLCRAANIGAGFDAMGDYYERLPVTARKRGPSRCAVIRQYLVLAAHARGQPQDAAFFDQLSDRAVQRAAKSLGLIV